MENEMTAVPEVRHDLALARAPKQVLAEAQEAAKSLQSVIAGRKNAVKFNGKHYLSFEDWQTCGRFYGVTAKIVSTEYIELYAGYVNNQQIASGAATELLLPTRLSTNDAGVIELTLRMYIGCGLSYRSILSATSGPASASANFEATSS